MKPIDAALLSGGVAAFAGAMTGILALSGAIGLTMRAPGTPIAPPEARWGLGGFLLASHAITAAALWQAPTVGSCMAASLGAGWIAAAAAGLVALMLKTDQAPRRAVAIAIRAAIGFALFAPLWAYIQLMRMPIMPGVTA
jgi:hypothetical protein